MNHLHYTGNQIVVFKRKLSELTACNHIHFHLSIKKNYHILKENKMYALKFKQN